MSKSDIQLSLRLYGKWINFRHCDTKGLLEFYQSTRFYSDEYPKPEPKHKNIITTICDIIVRKNKD